MKIHLARLRENELSPWQSPLPVWNQLIDLSQTHAYFTDNPAEAHRIIFIDLHQAHTLNIRQSIFTHELYNHHKEKILVWNEQDRPLFDVRGLYVNVPMQLGFQSTIAPIPYLFVPADSLFHGTNFGTMDRNLVCVYRGTNTHKCRKVLSKLRLPNCSILDTTSENSISKSEYLAELDKSVHALCPRGHGLTSFRLYEAMARGCLPVIIADGWVPPKGISWKTFCTFIDEKDVTKLTNHLKYSQPEIDRRQEILTTEYDAYLAPNVRIKYFLNQISDIPYGDCLSIPIRATYYNLNLKLRQKINKIQVLRLPPKSPVK